MAGVANATAVANANTKTAAALQLGCARDPRPMAAFLWRGHLQMCNTKPHTTPQRHHLQFGTRCECELRLEIAAHVLSQPGLRGKKLANGDNDHHFKGIAYELYAQRPLAHSTYLVDGAGPENVHTSLSRNPITRHLALALSTARPQLRASLEPAGSVARSSQA